MFVSRRSLRVFSDGTHERWRFVSVVGERTVFIERCAKTGVGEEDAKMIQAVSIDPHCNTIANE